jgi:predicted ATPase
VTVLIGPNGSGKSNLLHALRMVRELASGALQLYVGRQGGASYLMHYGPERTHAIELELEFHSDDVRIAYQARLGRGAHESVFFDAERVGSRGSADEEWRWDDLGAGQRESALREALDTNATARTVRPLLLGLNFYHFHDTSLTSPLRSRDHRDASPAFLSPDGSNLPAFLLALRESETPDGQAAWRRILGTLRRVAPFVADVTPVRDAHGVRLEWADDQGAVFGPAHFSDGTLRALALIAALAQPESRLPLVSGIDEPELGLHPAALDVLCGLVSAVATRHQVILATQSPAVLDHFEPADVTIVERNAEATAIRRLDAESLKGWLEDYTLSELYDKNVLGGRP